ncbi:DNA repair protein RecN [Prochlorococcus marinus]|uniref:DNA repair protein RecN n=1 Tax=Prochlorococcus marinus XMU1408 TaxID=2213228 RepID=A0A318R161_PROMR|nr:DNA repair protein RecN [Prochlorococcus marinus]MBW3042976.1 DNA repair protein RecN [Prochlorococcus marinus str. XMU1408]PYE00327.1 DNA repair protein RecN [Prochlorococcus marinus XMU1408]
MLKSLRFQNISLFGNLEIDFDKGFTAFTGETGSGKSIFIDTLNSLLACKKIILDNKLVEKDSSFSSIEGVFYIFSNTKDWLINQEFDFDDELIVTREWRLKENKYKSRFRINGVLANREQISQLRSLLLDFTLQGDTYILNNRDYQLTLLDSLDLEKIEESIKNVNQCWKNWHESYSQLKQAQEKIIDFKNQFEELQYIYQDLEKLELKDPKEDRKLEMDQNRLSNLYRLKEGVKTILLRLNEGVDEYPSLLDHTNFCINELKLLSQIDSSLETIFNNFSTLTNNFYDLTYQIKDYEQTLDIDPSYLNDLQIRLSTLKLYQKKYQRNLPELISYKNELFKNLSFQDNSNNIEELISFEHEQRIIRDQSNKNLSNMRKKIALKLEDKLITSLKELGMPNVRFKVLFEEREPTVNGIDRVNFMFSANPGFPLAPLAEVASGGEKSRVLLAIKAIFASFDQTNLLIFDEIDSGVSGSVSSYVANLLNQLSCHRQVFCVTHQPLIAAFADNHFAFKKIVIAGKTVSKLTNLKEIADRQKELALLAGGEIVEANAYAASLLEHKAA